MKAAPLDLRLTHLTAPHGGGAALDKQYIFVFVITFKAAIGVARNGEKGMSFLPEANQLPGPPLCRRLLQQYNGLPDLGSHSRFAGLEFARPR